MLRIEQRIGDYFNEPGCFIDISPAARNLMLELIHELTESQGANCRTFFLAGNIADKYLATLAVYRQAAPSLIALSVVAFLIASQHYSTDRLRMDDFLTMIKTWKIK